MMRCHGQAGCPQEATPMPLHPIISHRIPSHPIASHPGHPESTTSPPAVSSHVTNSSLAPSESFYCLSC